MKNKLKIFFIFFAIIIFFFLLAFVLYISKSSPEYNNFVNGLFKISKEDVSVSVIENQVEITEIQEQEDLNTITNGIPVLLSYEKNATEIVNEYSEYQDFDFTLDNNNYKLYYNQLSWTYENPYPIISEPVAFSDAVIFIDAEPAMVCLDKQTGNLQQRLPCDIFPKGPAYSLEKSYIFEAKAGGWFQIHFQQLLGEWPTSLELKKPTVTNKDFTEMLIASVFPSLEAQARITTSMNNYVSSSEENPLPDILLYDTSSQIIEFQHTYFSPLYIFSPEEQGSYTFGICDSQGSWIRDNSFTVLFSKNGEVEAISLDYVADRPQISIHLSDTQLYYVCCGFLGGEEVSSSFFQVKKDPS